MTKEIQSMSLEEENVADGVDGGSGIDNISSSSQTMDGISQNDTKKEERNEPTPPISNDFNSTGSDDASYNEEKKESKENKDESSAENCNSSSSIPSSSPASTAMVAEPDVSSKNDIKKEDTVDNNGEKASASNDNYGDNNIQKVCVDDKIDNNENNEDDNKKSNDVIENGVKNCGDDKKEAVQQQEESQSSAAVDDILGGLFEEFGDSIRDINETVIKTAITPPVSPTKTKKKKKKVKSTTTSPNGKKKKRIKKKKKKKKLNGNGEVVEEEKDERVAGISTKDLEDILMQKIQFRKVLKEQQQQEEKQSKTVKGFFSRLVGKTKTETLEDEKQKQLDALLSNIKDPELRNEIDGSSRTLEGKSEEQKSSSSQFLLRRILPESIEDVKERRLRELRQHMTDPELKEELVAQSHQIMLTEDLKEERKQLGIVSSSSDDEDNLGVKDLIDPELLKADIAKRKEKMKEDHIRQQMEEQLQILDPNFDDDDLYEWQLSVLKGTGDSTDDDDDYNDIDDDNDKQHGNGGSFLGMLSGRTAESDDDEIKETLEEEMERKRVALQLYLKAVDPELESMAISSSNTQDLLLMKYKMTNKLEEIEENPTKFGFDGSRVKALKSALAESPMLKKMTTPSEPKPPKVSLSAGI